MKKIVNLYNNTPLVAKIIAGLILGIILGIFIPKIHFIVLLGTLFVGALKAIAPVLVFALVSAALAQKKTKVDNRFSLVITLYILSTLLASLTAVGLSFLFPQKLQLTALIQNAPTPPSGIDEILNNLFLNMVSNPIDAIVNGQYIGILFWAILFGLAIKNTTSISTKKVLQEVSSSISKIVVWVINFAPFGIMGLVYKSVSYSGLSFFKTYGKLILLLIASMLLVMLIINPIISFLCMRRNPYPLLWQCIVKSGITAFFVISSAANIPVNMSLCEKLKLDKEMYSVSIPLGATINMNGAAITITVMTLAAAYTLGIQVDLFSAVLLSFLSALAACGASGVAGGSLLLIPLACSMFGISNDIAMHVVAVGFIIGVIQDSLETMLNSSGDVFFTATSEYTHLLKQGKDVPEIVGGTIKLDL